MTPTGHVSLAHFIPSRSSGALSLRRQERSRVLIQAGRISDQILGRSR